MNSRPCPALVHAFTLALLLGSASAWAEQKPTPTNPGQPSGTPTSTPTWTVPGAANQSIGKKPLECPPDCSTAISSEMSPNSTGTSQSATPAKSVIKPDGFQQIGGNPGNPWDPQGKCYVGPPPKHYRCEKGMVMVDLDPSPKVCWRCVVPME